MNRLIVYVLLNVSLNLYSVTYGDNIYYDNHSGKQEQIFPYEGYRFHILDINTFNASFKPEIQEYEQDDFDKIIT